MGYDSRKPCRKRTALQKAAGPEERALWRRLEGGIDGMRCYWRAPIGDVHPVVYCPKAGLAVMIHEPGDRVRWPDGHGLTVLTFAPGEAAKSLDDAVRWIRSTAVELAARRPAPAIRDAASRGRHYL
jgi:hypothetical protein